MTFFMLSLVTLLKFYSNGVAAFEDLIRLVMMFGIIPLFCWFSVERSESAEECTDSVVAAVFEIF